MSVTNSNTLSLITILRRGIFIALLITLFPILKLFAGVLVAPPVVFISEANKTGRMTVQNPTNIPREVSISFSFGIPESDSLGNVNVHLQDSAVTDPRSALGWVRAFPRKLVIPANGSQVVRFVANPPRDLPDGEYWCRVIVEAQEGTTNIPSPTAEDQITTKLNMIMRTAIMLKYRTGDLFANLELRETKAKTTDSNVELLVDFTNKGNVSYIGMLSCRLLDAHDREISKDYIQLAVYRDLMRRVVLPINEGQFLKPYKVEVAVSNKGRKDIPAEEMIYGNEILYTMKIEE